MFSCIYVEQSLANHPLTQGILQRFEAIPHVVVQRYGEVFNRKAQNFRLQKNKPALILARKHERFVLPAPPGYGFGEGDSYYFSHMLNCIYDCRYCFLQGMYRSAHYVLFVNFEDYQEAIETILRQPGSEQRYFYSGYDCDSLALEPVSGFAAEFIPWFAQRPQAWFEVRTKSTQIRNILSQKVSANCVLAYSFTPEDIWNALEHKVPALNKRIDALLRLQQQGWRVALRFEPVIYQENLQAVYTQLYERIFSVIDAAKLHSVSIGMFRVPRDYFKNMQRLYPQEKLFALDFLQTNGLISYPPELETQMVSQLKSGLLNYVSADKFYHCSMGQDS
ncbi:MAG: DNA photolyase [Gammaproteobacteria bacterium]|nr:DNA photolyase [Gammaproteobacteria bacterium]MDH5801061.1 DNA photolyase [Gammaproteobacteria bacterium]